MSSYQPLESSMNRRTFYLAIFLFVCIITFSNFLVNFRIMDTYVTYGALIYPLSFLLMDILSEKYSRKEVLRALRAGLLLALIPSLCITNDIRIAFASIGAFFVSQFLDIFIFYKLKEKFPSLWWLRNGVSTSFAQCIDTFIFFHIAFLFVLPYYEVFMLFVFDYLIKFAISIFDIPIFYLVAIKTCKKIKLFR
ncbi:VUT family protein [Helicobacter aurati]|uniref:Probable queuosine precursor transporter n=1 Tax=Helicobacter aurati TaxID=137778 RepID=A0A3D8J7G9_9HELI|nr:queuosine precursor transporter [Helicobacter aurati]RDU73362.1 VUT family protein [Helicobacter aurati]